MTGPLYPANMATHGPARSLESYLAELQHQYDALPFTSPARGDLATRIRAVEAEIDAQSGGGAMDAPTKEFPTADVLSTITGRLLTADGTGCVYLVLNWMTGEIVYTHQIPRIIREAQAAMVRLRPELAAAVAESKQVNRDNWRDFLALWIDRYGSTIAVPKLPADEHDRIDPISELAEMVPPERIIVVKVRQP